MANGADGSIIIDTELDSSGFQAGSRQMLSAAARLTQSITSQGKSLQQNLAAVMRSAAGLGNMLGRMSDKSSMGFTSETQVDRFALDLDKAQEKVADLEAAMAEIGEQQVATQEYSEIQKQIQQAEAALSKLQDKQAAWDDAGVRKTSDKYKDLLTQIQRVQEVLGSARYEASTMEQNGTAFTSGKDSPQYQALAQQLEAYKAALAEFQQAEADARIEIQQEADANDRATAAKERAKMAAKAAEERHKALANAMRTVVNAAKAIPRAMSGMVGSLKKYFGIGQKSDETTANLIKGLTGLGRMLKSRIKERFITELFKGLGTAFSNLAKYSTAFNASMSSMKNSMTGLSGNIAVAAGNLVNAFAPAISTIIDWISKAISYLNAFFALLQGKSTFTKAKTATDDYAKSLQGAGGAAKDLKNQVYGFDELNKEQDNSGGGSGAGGAEYEDVDIASFLPESLTQLFNNIKAAFEAGEWEKVGSLIGNALNGVVTAVDDWIVGTLEPAALTWTENIARVLNGFVTGLNWGNLGNLFADGLNVITRTVNTFVGTFNWVSLGTALGQGANGLVNGIDWASLGAAFVAKTNAIWQTLYGFVTSFNWPSLGANLAVGANSAFYSINWTQLATGIGVGVNGIWTAFWTAVAQFDWTGVGATLAEAVNTLFATEGGPINWAAAGESLTAALVSLIDGINTFLAGVNWQQIGTDVATFIASIDWTSLVTSLVTGIGIAIGGLAELLSGLIDPAWESVKTWWDGIMQTSGGDLWSALCLGFTTAIAGLSTWLMDSIVTPFVNGIRTAFGLDSISSSDIYQMGADLWDGFTQGISNAWSAVTTWVDTNIVQPFVNAVKSFFGIASPSTVMQEIGGFLIEGMQNGITTAWETLTAWLGTALEGITASISTAWDNITTAASTAWEGISATVTGLWDGMTSTLSTGWETLKTNLSDAWTSIESTASTWWSTISSTVTSAWSGMTTTLSTGWESLKTDLSSAWESISTTASTWWDSITTTVTGWADSIWSGVTTTATTIGTDLSTAWEDMKTTAGTAWESMKTTVVGWWDNLVSAVKGEDWKSVGKGVVDGTESGITSNWASFKSRVTGWFSGLISSVKKTLGIHSPSTVFASIGDYCMQGLSEGMQDREKDVSKTVSNIAEAVSDGMNLSSDLQLKTSFDDTADKLSKIADIFSAIADSITRMGGFNIPQIAAGSVLPYKARTDSGNEATREDVLSVFSNNFDDTMTDQLDVLLKILEAIRSLNLTVDIDSLTRAITSRQRATARAYGGA